MRQHNSHPDPWAGMAVVAFRCRHLRHRSTRHPWLGGRRARARLRAEGAAVLAQRVARATGLGRGEVAAAARRDGRAHRPSAGRDVFEHPRDADHPGPRRAGRLLQQVPATAPAGGDGAADRRRGCPLGRPDVGDHPRPDAATDPRLHGAGRLDHRDHHQAPLGRPDPAGQPLRRPDRRAAHAAGLRTREGSGEGPAGERGAAPVRDDDDPAGVVPLCPRAGAAGHLERRADRGHDRLPRGLQ